MTIKYRRTGNWKLTWTRDLERVGKVCQSSWSWLLPRQTHTKNQWSLPFSRNSSDDIFYRGSVFIIVRLHFNEFWYCTNFSHEVTTTIPKKRPHILQTCNWIPKSSFILQLVGDILCGGEGCREDGTILRAMLWSHTSSLFVIMKIKRELIDSNSNICVLFSGKKIRTGIIMSTLKGNGKWLMHELVINFSASVNPLNLWIQSQEILPEIHWLSSLHYILQIAESEDVVEVKRWLCKYRIELEKATKQPATKFTATSPSIFSLHQTFLHLFSIDAHESTLQIPFPFVPLSV